jgi:hypothetical protein
LLDQASSLAGGSGPAAGGIGVPETPVRVTLTNEEQQKIDRVRI